MRLAQVMAGARQGGAELFFERLTIALANAGDAVLPIIRHDPDRATRLAGAGLAPLQLRFGQHLDFGTAPALRRALRAHAPGVVVAWMNRAGGYAGRARVGADWTLVGRLGGYYDLRHYRRCDHLVGNTRALRDWLVAQGWPRERAHVLPNFVPDLGTTQPAPRARRLLAAGRLHANKGVDVLLRALALLPDVHLDLAGAGPEEPALRRLADELGIAGRVGFLGWRAAIGPLLANCDVFVCPSRHEPLGNVVLEAWSAGRPVVAAAAAGPAELIADGINGLLVPLEAPPPLAAAIGRVLDDAGLAQRLAAAGRAAFLRDHAEGPVVAHWRTFLARVAPGARGGALTPEAREEAVAPEARPEALGQRHAPETLEEARAWAARARTLAPGAAPLVASGPAPPPIGRRDPTETGDR